MDKNKRKNLNFVQIRIFEGGIKQNEIKIPIGSIKSFRNVTLKDKADSRIFVIEKKFADILEQKL